MEGRASLAEEAFAGEANGAFLTLLGRGVGAFPSSGWDVLALRPQLGALTCYPSLAAASYDGG